MTAHRNILVHLLAFAGTGKLTIARVLCNEMDAVLVDSHLINNPVFRIFKADGITRLPPSVWPLAKKIRHAVFEAIETCRDQGNSYVFTNVLYANDPEDEINLREMLAFCARTGLTYIPVRLLCSEEELIRRRTNPGRKEHLKDINADNARKDSRERTLAHTNHPNELTLDVTTLPPEESAKHILAHIDAILARKAA